jgi:acyl-CoA dehydrogenase
VTRPLFEPAHDRLRVEVAGWVAAELAPHAGAWDAAQAFPKEMFAAAGRAGLFGWKVPREHGGTGPDFLADAVVSEELVGCGSGGVAAALGAHKDLGPYYIARFGTDEQRTRWLPGALAGTAVGALAVTEPGAGSDVAGLRTRARPQPGGDWLLHGAKTFITNGTWADQIVVAALTDPGQGGHHGLSLFVVEGDDRGLERRRITTLGWRPSHTAELAFADLRLPADRLLGGPDLAGQGFSCIMRNFQWERIVMALAASRSAALLLDDAAAALRGLPAARAAWRMTFAELATDVAAARSLTEHALRLHADGQDVVREVSMAKSMACLVSVQVAEAAVAALGPAAAERFERSLRDARLGPIGGGTTEIMREVIGRSYGL